MSVNVTGKLYGADPTGTRDSTAAIQSAARRAARSGGAVLIPSGSYLVSGLKLPAGTVLQGVTGQGYYNATAAIPGPGTVSRLILAPGSTQPLISPG